MALGLVFFGSYAAAAGPCGTSYSHNIVNDGCSGGKCYKTQWTEDVTCKADSGVNSQCRNDPSYSSQQTVTGTKYTSGCGVFAGCYNNWGDAISVEDDFWIKDTDYCGT
jgi:hypothetical protein